MLVPQNLVDMSADRQANAEPKAQNIVDSSILMHVIDLLSTLLKKTKDKTLPDF